MELLSELDELLLYGTSTTLKLWDQKILSKLGLKYGF